MTRKQVLFLVAKFAFSALLLCLVLTKVDPAGIVARLHTADLRWLLAAVLLGPVVVVVSAWRWQTLSLGLLGYGEAVRYTWIGLFFGSILPGVVGGDVAKGLSLAARDERTRDSRLPISIIADKLVGFWLLLALFTLVAIALLAGQSDLIARMRGALWAAGGATFIGLAAGVAALQPKGTAWLALLASKLPSATLQNGARRVFAALASYSGQGRAVGRAMLLSIVVHGLNALCLWLVMRSLAIPATPLFAAVFYALLSVLISLPVSISGVGVRDVFAAGIFTAFGLNPESGVAFSWLLLGLSLPNVLVGGGIQLWEIFRRRSDQ